MSKVKYTPTEDMAIYRHIANRPEGVTISRRIKSCIKLKSVHPCRTEHAIRNRWSILNGNNPPANISKYKFWNGRLTTPEQSPITALGDTFKNVQEYRGVDIYVGVKQMEWDHPAPAYASVEVEFEEAPKPPARKCNTLDEAIEELRKQGAKKAVIPLRDNKKITVIFKD
jgi:hypothetical protein